MRRKTTNVASSASVRGGSVVVEPTLSRIIRTSRLGAGQPLAGHGAAGLSDKTKALLRTASLSIVPQLTACLALAGMPEAGMYVRGRGAAEGVRRSCGARLRVGLGVVLRYWWRLVGGIGLKSAVRRGSACWERLR